MGTALALFVDLGFLYDGKGNLTDLGCLCESSFKMATKFFGKAVL